MSGQVEFRVLELLCARLCHELVSPVGAINNGVELLDEDDPDFVKDAISLIGQSARKAGQRLQFYRFAYGGSGASIVAGRDGRDLATGLLEGGKVRCEWREEATTLPADWQKLACNMLVLAAEVLPHGGLVEIRPLHDGSSGIEAAAQGDTINLSAELREAFAQDAAVDALTSRTVHAYFTANLARQMGARLTLSLPQPGTAILTARAGG